MLLGELIEEKLKIATVKVINDEGLTICTDRATYASIVKNGSVSTLSFEYYGNMIVVTYFSGGQKVSIYKKDPFTKVCEGELSDYLDLPVEELKANCNAY